MIKDILLEDLHRNAALALQQPLLSCLLFHKFDKTGRFYRGDLDIDKLEHASGHSTKAQTLDDYELEVPP